MRPVTTRVLLFGSVLCGWALAGAVAAQTSQLFLGQGSVDPVTHPISSQPIGAPGPLSLEEALCRGDRTAAATLARAYADCTRRHVAPEGASDPHSEAKRVEQAMNSCTNRRLQAAYEPLECGSPALAALADQVEAEVRAQTLADVRARDDRPPAF